MLAICLFLCHSRLPEIGEDDPKLNPFIKEDEFPEFSNITVDRCLRRIGKKNSHLWHIYDVIMKIKYKQNRHCLPGYQSAELEEQVKSGEAYLQQLNESGKSLTLKTFLENVLHPIETADKEMATTWGLAKTIFHGNNVMFATKNFISVHQRARTANLSKYSSRPIYEAARQLRATLEKSDELTTELRRLLDMYLLEGKLCGLNITKSVEKEEIQYLQHKLSEEMITFESKTYVAVDHFTHTIRDYSLVQAFPPEFLQAVAVDRKNPLNGPWTITLRPNILKHFLAYCPEREQRWNLWQANNRKVSRQVVVELDNSGHLEWIRDHRHRMSALMGYGNYVELKRDRYLLHGTEKPETILNELRTYAKPTQQKEIDLLSDFAMQSGYAYARLDEYDVPYWCRKYNITVCKYDENLIREYLPAEKVFSGLFQLAEKFFDIKIVERHAGDDQTISKWHKDVKYFDVFDMRKSNIRSDAAMPIGGFFLDTCSSPDVESHFHAPMGHVVPIHEHCQRTNTTPMMALIFNFNGPLYGKPHTLKLDQVEVVFSKFGNLLQKLLNASNYRELSGLINVEYVNDKICSGVFSHLLYRNDVLKLMSEHISTKEPLTDELIDAIKSQRLTLAGHSLSTELFKSYLDLELYTTQTFWLELLRKHYARHMVFDLDKRDSRLLSMLDIVVQNWAGSYYGLVWSNIMAADIYDAFDKSRPPTNPSDDTTQKVGQRFRDTFLTSGSNTDSLELFRNFRGRDPALDALVSTYKLVQAKSE